MDKNTNKTKSVFNPQKSTDFSPENRKENKLRFSRPQIGVSQLVRGNKKYAVIGSSDSRCGDFVINHWLLSLEKNIDRKLVDIVILNYGLTEKQKKMLLSKAVIVVDCIKDGHIVNLRYRDMLNYLNGNKYEQVMACDSGDIIFQKNIMGLFNQKPDSFRVVIEDIQPPTLEYSLAKKTFSKKVKEELLKVLKDKKMANGGMIVAPAKKFKLLCKEMLRLIQRLDSFGPDQIILNYVIYKIGFYDLGEDFNYIPVTAKTRFYIKNGIFYNKNNGIISIVHNAGHSKIFRVINDFGYGPEHNKFKFFTYIFLRIIYKCISGYSAVKYYLSKK